MEKKEQYEELAVEVICFDPVDIVITSDPNESPLIGG